MLLAVITETGKSEGTDTPMGVRVAFLRATLTVVAAVLNDGLKILLALSGWATAGVASTSGNEPGIGDEMLN